MIRTARTPSSPKVSIIMAVYNDAIHLPATLTSLAAQTYTNYELLIVDDASTDASASLLAKAAREDSRIRIITNKTNLRLPRNLNILLTKAKGKYIARMDADDIALPTRLQEQVAFLEAHPDVIALGTWAEKFDAETGPIRTPVAPAAVHAHLPFLNPFVHPSVMLRASTLKQHGVAYDPAFYVEDYHLWVRLAQFGKFANLPRVLLNYRVRTGSMTSSSSSFRRAEIRPVLKIALTTHFNRLHKNITIPTWWSELHSRFALHEELTLAQALALPLWLAVLLIANPTPTFAATLSKRCAAYLFKALRGALLQPQPTSTWKPQ